MPTVSDYVAVRDGSVTLQIGGDVDESYTFTIPNNLNTGSRAVATWMMEVENNPNNLQWELTINGTQVKSFTHSSDRFAAAQEVIDGSLLGTGNNQAEVRVFGGGGRLKFGDFVVHFQVDV